MEFALVRTKICLDNYWFIFNCLGSYLLIVPIFFLGFFCYKRELIRFFYC